MKRKKSSSGVQECEERAHLKENKSKKYEKQTFMRITSQNAHFFSHSQKKRNLAQQQTGVTLQYF
jgi:hypothetical protein